MGSEEHRSPAPQGPLPRRLLGPKPLIMAGAALAVIAVVAVLAQLVMSSQSTAKEAARERFANGAVVRSQLTASLLSTSTASLRRAAAKLPATPKALSGFAKTSNLRYAALLSDDGTVLAASTGAPAALTSRLASRPGYVAQALSGRTWISNLQPAAKGGTPTFDWAIPFSTSSGRRVLVEGVPASTFGAFLTSYLSQGTSGRSIYVVDSSRRLIASSRSAELGKGGAFPAALAKAPTLASVNIDGRYVAAGTIGGSGWQLVLAQPEGQLYAGIGSSAWLLWVAVVLSGLIGLASLILLRRSHERAAELAAAHAELSALNATLEARVAERTELAERRAHALARSNAELEQFASVAAHDLQEPLRKIRMYCERLAASARGDSRRSRPPTWCAWRPPPAACRT